MKRSSVAVASLVGVVSLAGCNQRAEERSTAGAASDDTERVVSAVLADPATLANPEYDLDIPTDWHYFGSRPADDINATIADGFRLVAISAASPTLFNTTFVRNDDPMSPYYRLGNDWATGLTELDLTLKAADPAVRIVDIAPYLESGQRRYAAVWIDNTGTQHFDYKLILHTTPGDFQTQAQAVDASAPYGWRVIDVEAMPVPGGGTGQFEVSGVAVKNVDAASKRIQYFGYGPLAGNNVAPAGDPTQVQTMSLGKQVSDIEGRTADLSSPFGDGNFFWVAEETLDKSPRPESLADGASCLNVPDPSTERNWWFGNLQIASGADDEGKEEFVAHSLTRFGGRATKIKSYKATFAGNAVRYAGVIQDNGLADPTGTATGGNPVLKKLDAAFINRMKRWGLPGGALAVVKDGQLIFSRGYGHSNLTIGRPVQSDDLFRLASVSKPIAQSLFFRLLNADSGSKPVHTLSNGPVTLETHPFGEIFPYTKPARSGTCDVDGKNGTFDTTGCTLGDIRIRDLLYHRSGLINALTPAMVAAGDNALLAFSYDIPSSLIPKNWIDREPYWDCLTTPSAPSCAGSFISPPGVTYSYMNAEYQMVFAVVETLSGMKYEDYLAEVLAPLHLDRLRPALASTVPDNPMDVVQTIPYTIPIPAFIPVPEGAVRSADSNVLVPQPPIDGNFTRSYLGSASIATSMVDLVRWATSINGSRGGYRIMPDDAFNTQFRGSDPGCQDCPPPPPVPPAPPLVPPAIGYPFEHGGVFNWDAQARVRMLANKVTYAYAVNGDSLWAENDLCCPGTTNCGTVAPSACPNTAVPTGRNSHGIGTFDFELREDLDNILGGGPAPGCAASLPDFDHFSKYHSEEPHALCTDISPPAGPTCTATIDVSSINAGSTGGTISLNPTTSTFSPGTYQSGLQVENTLGISRCGARVVVKDVTAPTITLPPPVTTSICGPSAVVTIGKATATDNCVANPQVIGNIVSKNGVPLSPPINVPGTTATLTPGTYVVHWSANDGALSVGGDQTVVVNGDTTVPVLTAPPSTTVKICQTHAVAAVGQATATDNCPVTITGQVIASNGVTLSPPITFTGGQVDLGIGTHTIQWTATDGVNPSPPITRTATVNPTIEASNSFDVQDRAQIRTTGSAFAAVLNSGTLSTHLGQQAHTGAILSVAPVTIDNAATVDGTVTSAATVAKNPGATTGTVTEHATVVLPALPALPSFPAATGGFDVNSGTRNQAPGSFTTVNVNGGTLVLASGDYYFQTLTMNSNGTVRVTPTTRVFVRDTLNYNTPFRATTGTAIQPITLGFAGSGTLFINIRFDGMLIAPSATVSLGAGAGVTFTGSFYGRKLQVNPASALVCSP